MEEENKTEPTETKEEKITVGSLVTYLGIAVDQTNALMDELVLAITGVAVPPKAEETTPVGLLENCVSLADKIITIRNKAQELKDTI